MQKKSKLVVLLIAGTAGVIAFLVVLILISKSGNPVKIALQSYTNGQAVISINNQTPASIDFLAMLERKMGRKWPDGLVVGPGIPDPKFGSLGSGHQTNLTIKVLVEAPSYPWRISVVYSRPAPHVNSFRFRAGLWCATHRLSYVSQELLGTSKPIQISTPEMAQIGSVTKN
jgi:hypothetical protein